MDKKLKDVKNRVKKAAAFVRSRAPQPPVSPELMRSAAERHGLPIGEDVAGHPTARAIFIASYSDASVKQVKEKLGLAYKAIVDLIAPASAPATDEPAAVQAAA